ncbi:MAG: hypothetical protein WC932_06270 [archaeon]|jgi:hypothetical protein
MKTEITQIIKELKEVITEENMNILDKDILDSALRIYLTNSINKQKQFSKPTYSKPFIKNALENEKPANEQLATKNQLWRLKKENIPIPLGLTKQKASELIKQKENEQ